MTTQTPPHHTDSGHGPESAKSHRYPPPPPPTAPTAPYQGLSYGAPAGPQQTYGASGATTAKPSTYWPLSIISFLCSFLFGGIGMYFSAQVNSRWNAGDVEGARKASKTALIIDIVGIVIGVLVLAASSSG
jgi:hypothetical protein